MPHEERLTGVTRSITTAAQAVVEENVTHDAFAGAGAGSPLSLLRLAEVQRFRRECNKATTLYSEAMQICTDIGDELGRATALYGLAKVHRRQGDYGEAIELSHQVI